MTGSVEHDKRQESELRDLGWRVETVCECEGEDALRSLGDRFRESRL
jgi:G:T-mismatch repair DNA endonuclease (very short patch repair protein)